LLGIVGHEHFISLMVKGQSVKVKKKPKSKTLDFDQISWNIDLIDARLVRHTFLPGYKSDLHHPKVARFNFRFILEFTLCIRVHIIGLIWTEFLGVNL
jgi:hypothetical protein